MIKMAKRLSLFLYITLTILVNGQFWDNIQTPDIECSEDQNFLCPSGQCIPKLALCDGFPDCLDETDEQNCNHGVSQKICEAEKKFMCKDESKCIPVKYVCNHLTDCDDNSDEIGCKSVKPKNTTCRGGVGYQCRNGQCISRHFVCDGAIDCADSSDENKNSCLFKYFDNQSQRNIQYCPDTEKETSSMFYCRDKSNCIEDIDLCNGLRDCLDSSDEGPYCLRWGVMCNDINCERECKPTPYGPRCVCDQVTIGATDTCSTVDYCKTMTSPCSQLCSNGRGSYTCSCVEGYKLENKTLCLSTGADPLLYYTSGQEIRRYNIKSAEDTLILQSKKPLCVKSDGTNLYWIEIYEGNSNVMQANIQNVTLSKEVLLSIGLGEPDDIAIDWLGKNIYFTESKHSYIAVCTLTGSVCTRLRDSRNIKHPKLITLNPEAGIMYWVDLIDVPRIQRSRMDGTDITTLTINRYYPPTALALDIPNSKIYWVEPEVGISVMNFDGTGKYELRGRFIYRPFTLSVFENELYWYDLVSKQILSNSKMEGEARFKELLKLHMQATSIDIYHPVLMQKRPHGCQHAPCSDICLLSTDMKYTCACSDDATLAVDKHNCWKTNSPHYLLAVGKNTATKIHFHTLAKPENDTIRLDVGRIQAIAHNPNDNVVYMYDAFRKMVYRLPLNNFGKEPRETLNLYEMQDIIDMGYDYVTDNLYYLDVGLSQSTIVVYSIKKSLKSVVHVFEEDETPLSLCIIPEYGSLIVAFYQGKNGNISVDKFGMDGKDRFHLFATKYEGLDVTVRYSSEEDKVYISNPAENLIEQMHPEGTGREYFRRVPTSVSSLTVAQQLVFWTDLHSGRLFWSSVEDHSNRIGSMELSINAHHARLHLLGISPTPDPKPQDPCKLNQANCSYVCAQTVRLHRDLANHFTCLCPSGQVMKDGVCFRRVFCSAGELSCYNSNACYNREKKCDGIRDCPKGEDESHCADGTICKHEEYNCPNTSRCLARHQLCDGSVDCPDSSDEHASYCPIRSCQDGEFTCSTGGLCILSSWVCDGEKDCPGGDDEAHCADTSCEPGSYKCRDGQCVDVIKRCDGRKDCLDWSDEEDCDYDEEEVIPEVITNRCMESEYVCPTNKSICLPYTARCDGKVDCPEGGDEIDCVDFSCAPGYFQCKHWQQCIPYTDVCNKRNDCDDGSDETKLACSHHKNETTTLAPEIEEPCDSGYKCDNRMCVELSSACNGVKDCPDGSDEGGLCNTTCNRNRCEHLCKATPRGPLCHCHEGFSIDITNNRTCKDIDECERVGDIMCSHICTNIIGNYLCSCYKGYALRRDGHSCKSTTANNTILFLSGNTVKAARAHELYDTILYGDVGVKNMYALDYDPRLKILYVTTKDELLAFEENKNMLNVTNIGKPTWVAADWITGNVYTVDSTPNNQSIRVCNLEKNVCARMHSIPNYVEVTTLTIDPINRKMFFCAWDEFSQGSIIYQARLSGGNVTVFKNVKNCTGLTVDYHKGLLYVAMSDGRIKKITYNGLHSKDIVYKDFYLKSPYGLQLFEDHIYTIDTVSQKITRCLSFGSKRCEPYIYRIARATSFIIRHENVELSEAEDHCDNANCNFEGCIDKPECVCYNGDVATKTDICLVAPPEAYYVAFPVTVKDINSIKLYVLMCVVLLTLIFCICYFMWRNQSDVMRSIFWEPFVRLSNRYRVRREQPRLFARYSWTSPRVTPDDATPDLTPELTPETESLRVPAVEIHAPQPPDQRPAGGSSGFTKSFVNIFYSSILRRKKVNEPTVSVHFQGTNDEGTEMEAGPSGVSRPVPSETQPVVGSDTESEMDDKDMA